MTTQSTTPSTESRVVAYLAGIATLRSSAVGLSAAQINRRCAPGTWSIMEIILHMVDCDISATHRMRRIAAEDSPLLASFDENALIDRLDNASMDFAEALDLFEANRKFTARWLRTLPLEAFERTGIHTQRGKMTLGEILVNYTKHVDHHDVFVRGKRKSMGV